MYKSIFLLLFFLIFSDLKGQEINNGRIVYKASTIQRDLSLLKNASFETTERIQNLYKNASDLDVELIFNRDLSQYKLIEHLAFKDGEQINLTYVASGSDHIYFQKPKTFEVINQTSTLGETFLVSSRFPEWEISGETKHIGNYKVYKAWLSSSENNSVIAWFTPEINYPYGPLGYGGLPGLILELQDSKVLFKMKSLNFNLESLELNEPSKGKKVTKQEYKDIAKKSMPGFFKKN